MAKSCAIEGIVPDVSFLDQGCTNMQTVLPCTVVAEQLWQTYPEQSPQLWQLLQQWRLSLGCPGLPGVHGSATIPTTRGSSATASSHRLPCLFHSPQGTPSPEVRGKTVLIEITERFAKVDNINWCSQPGREVLSRPLTSGETVPG